ncbi:uncharacterized protein LOC144107810 isoform X2 [Amblyomma americanum]
MLRNGFASRMRRARENPASIVGAYKCSPPILPKSRPAPAVPPPMNVDSEESISDGEIISGVDTADPSSQETTRMPNVKTRPHEEEDVSLTTLLHEMKNMNAYLASVLIQQANESRNLSLTIESEFSKIRKDMVKSIKDTKQNHDDIKDLNARMEDLKTSTDNKLRSLRRRVEEMSEEKKTENTQSPIPEQKRKGKDCVIQ